jgi:hypothetical protein
MKAKSDVDVKVTFHAFETGTLYEYECEPYILDRKNHRSVLNRSLGGHQEAI